MNNINNIWIDDKSISDKKYRHVLWQSLLLILLIFVTYTCIGFLNDMITVSIGLVFLVLSIYLLFKFKFRLFQFDKLRLKDWKVIGLFFIVIHIIYWLIAFINGQPTTQEDTYIDLANLPIIVSFLVFVIFAPVFEEIIFRSLMIKGVFKGHLLIGYIISSVLFSLIHGPTNAVEFLTYLNMGLIFGAVYLYTNRIETAILLHALNNLSHMIIFFVFFN